MVTMDRKKHDLIKSKESIVRMFESTHWIIENSVGFLRHGAEAVPADGQHPCSTYVQTEPFGVARRRQREAGYRVATRIVNMSGKVIGHYVHRVHRAGPEKSGSRASKGKRADSEEKTWSGYIPTYPSGIGMAHGEDRMDQGPEGEDAASAWEGDKDVRVEVIDYEGNAHMWRDLAGTIGLLTDVHERSGGRILSSPVIKVVDDGYIVGVVTETNQLCLCRAPS